MFLPRANPDRLPGLYLSACQASVLASESSPVSQSPPWVLVWLQGFKDHRRLFCSHTSPDGSLEL